MSLSDWLGAFVEAELSAAVQWKRAFQQHPLVKRDPEDRFGDDGSNLHATVACLHISEANVQVVRVLSVKDSAILVSDGTTEIKARLTYLARKSLEDGLEEALQPDSIKDVFRIDKVTVISTPFGMPDDSVQFEIHDLTYRQLLRRIVGQAQAVEQRPAVQALIQDLYKLRRDEYDSAGSAQNTATQRRGRPSRENEAAIDQSDDHFDDEEGATADKKVIKLVDRQEPGIVGRNVGDKIRPTDQDTMTSRASTESAALPRPIGPYRHTEHGSNTPSNDVEITSRLNSDRPTRPDLSVTQNFDNNEAPAAPSRAVAPRSTGLQNLASGSQRASADRLLASEYRGEHIRIPHDQQRILDRSTSWRPLVVQAASNHNVPARLLQDWEARAELDASRITTAHIDDEADVHSDGPRERALEEQTADADSSSDRSSSEEIELPWSQSSPVPARSRELPPDSSAMTRPPSPRRWNEQDGLEMDVPRALNDPPPPRRRQREPQPEVKAVDPALVHQQRKAAYFRAASTARRMGPHSADVSKLGASENAGGPTCQPSAADDTARVSEARSAPENTQSLPGTQAFLGSVCGSVPPASNRLRVSDRQREAMGTDDQPSTNLDGGPSERDDNDIAVGQGTNPIRSWQAVPASPPGSEDGHRSSLYSVTPPAEIGVSATAAVTPAHVAVQDTPRPSVATMVAPSDASVTEIGNHGIVRATPRMARGRRHYRPVAPQSSKDGGQSMSPYAALRTAFNDLPADSAFAHGAEKTSWIDVFSWSI